MNLLILGASARAAAGSALRAGLAPVAADLFADLDLARMCPATRIEPSAYPDGLAGFAATVPPMAWLPTGALENHPDLVDQISLRHRLLGTPGPALRAVRDPVRLAAALRARHLAAPEVRLDPAGVPADGTWLRKPIASAAGRGIAPWRGGPLRPGSCLQQRVPGLPLSALFVGRGGQAELAGISRQFLGGASSNSPFAYRGSLAPWPVPDPAAEEIRRIGHALAEAFGLVGLFGVDLILRDGRPWTVEVNPRYTASVEVVEWARSRSLLRDHAEACGLDLEPSSSHPVAPARIVAKAILRADAPCRWPDADTGPIDPHRFPRIADIPHPGTTFAQGDPVVTVFAAGPNPTACQKRIIETVTTLAISYQNKRTHNNNF